MAISEWETRIPGDICAGKHESLGICVCGEIFKKSLRETHITDSFWWETRIPSDMCRIPRDMCAGNTLPGETYITVTAVLKNSK